jgi:hypothetical protein
VANSVCATVAAMEAIKAAAQAAAKTSLRNMGSSWQ